MKKIVIGISVVLLFAVVVFYQRSTESQNYKERGDQLIEKVEIYKEQHGKLPETVADLDIEPEMGEGPYYEKLDDGQYTAYFNIGFDDMYAYYSDTGEWNEKP